MSVGRTARPRTGGDFEMEPAHLKDIQGSSFPEIRPRAPAPVDFPDPDHVNVQTNTVTTCWLDGRRSHPRVLPAAVGSEVCRWRESVIRDMPPR